MKSYLDNSLLYAYTNSMYYGVSRVAFSIFGLDVYWYGLIITFAIALAFGLSFLYNKQRCLPKDFSFDLILAIVPIGIVFARLFYCLFDASAGMQEFFNFRNGGLSILGALIGGAIGLSILCAVKKQNFLAVADVLVTLVLMCQAIGRWGNFFNQEVYGMVITNPAYQWFPLAVEVNGTYYMALFFYESVLNLLGAIVLIVLLYKTKTPGICSAVYLMWYGVVRAVLEGLRQEEYILKWGSVPISQLVSICMALAGLGLMIYWVCKVIKKKKEQIHV